MTFSDESVQVSPQDMPPLEPSAGDGDAWQQAHWAFIVIGALRNLRGWLVPLAFVMITQGFRGSRADFVWYGIALLATIGAVVSSVVEWWMYRYRITDRDITLKSGVISRQERVIPFERIQTVDLSDAPLERIFQVTKVRVETGAGGGNDAEIQIQALSHGDAVALRAHLLAARQRLRGEPIQDQAQPETGAIPAVHGEVAANGTLIRRISTRELLIAGATSGRVGAAAAIAGVMFQFAQEIVPQSVLERIPWDGFVDAASNLQIVATVVAVLGVLAWLISIIATVLTYGGFELRRDGDRLQVQYGLLDRRRTTIPINRIQAIRVTEGLFRQPFGYAEIRFHSAGFGADAGADGMLSPLLPRSEVYPFLIEACPEFAADLDPQGLHRLPARARQRYLVAATIGWIVFVALVMVFTWRFLDFSVWWIAPALLATPVFALLGEWRYRDAGWLVSDGDFLLRWRSISRVTISTQVRRLQYRAVTSNPLQRRANLATFGTAVASGASREGFSLPHLDALEAERLVQQLGGVSRSRAGRATAARPVLRGDARPETA